MDFRGPAPADYANVRSLNRSFLGLLRSSGPGAGLRRWLPEPVAPQIVGLSDLHLERLAGCPFLLLSLREDDVGFWQQLLADEPTGDLWAAPAGDAAERIVTAGLAFLWQLARDNPYAVRLIAGAGSRWCETIAATELVELLQRAAGRGNLLQPRFAGALQPWSRLLGPGIASRRAFRVATQLSVLQAMLTGSPTPERQPLRAAARASSVPALGITARSPRR